MIFWELIGNPSQNQWDFLTIDGDTPLAGMYGIPTCRNILRITLHEEISPISDESRPLLVWDVEGFSSPIPGAPSSEGVASCSLDGGMETRHLHAAVKKPI